MKIEFTFDQLLEGQIQVVGLKTTPASCRLIVLRKLQQVEVAHLHQKNRVTPGQIPVEELAATHQSTLVEAPLLLLPGMYFQPATFARRGRY